MLVHPDPEIEGRNEIDLKDINGKPIVRGIIGTVTTLPGKKEGWYHYEWPVPGQLLPRWKSTCVRLVTAPSGSNYVVAAGMYNDRMERAFVVDIVRMPSDKLKRMAEPLFRVSRIRQVRTLSRMPMFSSRICMASISFFRPFRVLRAITFWI